MKHHDEYTGNARADQPSGNLPDEYDLTLGKLVGLPGAAMTKPAIREVIEPIVGNAKTFIVRTVREQDDTAENPRDRAPRFTVLLQVTGRVDRPIRLVLPPSVTEIIDRQREALAGVARRKAARQAASTRKDRGIVPAFLKNPGKGGRRRKARRSTKGGAK